MDEDAGAKNELDVSSVLSVNFVGQRFALPEVIQQLLPLILPLTAENTLNHIASHDSLASDYTL